MARLYQKSKNMKRIFLITLSLAILGTNDMHASISWNIQADLLKNSGGVAMSTSGLVLFVSSTSDAIFDSILENSSTSIGSSLNGSDDKVLFRANLSSYGNGVLDLATGDLNLSSVTGWTSGDPLALMWFPTLTMASSTIAAGTQYGFYRNNVPVDGSQAWVTPGDPSSANALTFFTQDGVDFSPGAGAANPASAGNASLTVGAVPEPSRSLLGLIGIGVLALRRRR